MTIKHTHFEFWLSINYQSKRPRRPIMLVGNPRVRSLRSPSPSRTPLRNPTTTILCWCSQSWGRVGHIKLLRHWGFLTCRGNVRTVNMTPPIIWYSEVGEIEVSQRWSLPNHSYQTFKSLSQHHPSVSVQIEMFQSCALPQHHRSNYNGSRWTSEIEVIQIKVVFIIRDKMRVEVNT